MKAVTVSFVIAVAILALTPLSSRQQSIGPPAVPVAPQIAAAQKVFVSDVGGESLESVIDETNRMKLLANPPAAAAGALPRIDRQL